MARYLLANLADIPRMRASDIAAACYVSSPTVIRFCRELGFKDFSAFKQAAELQVADDTISQDWLGINESPLVVSAEAFPGAVEAWASSLHDVILHALTHADHARVEDLAADVFHFRRICCYGYDLSALFGDYLGSRLAFQSKAIITRSSLPTSSSSEGLDDDTLSIVVSLHGNLLRENPRGVETLSRGSACTWLVTMATPGSFNEGIFDDIVYLSDDNNTQMDAFVLLAFAELVGECCRAIWMREQSL